MITTIIIVAIAIFVLLAIVIKIGKKQVTFSNPIDGLHDGGTMGFFLGDKYEFCMSRFRHLKLSIDSNDFESKVYKLGISSNMKQYIVWGSNTFNNVKEVTFAFDNKRLCSISIDIDFSSEGITDMCGILVSRICRVLRMEPMLRTKDFTKWHFGKANITLSIYPNYMDRNSEKKLLIQILPN